MRYIVIPEPIQLTDLTTGKPLKVRDENGQIRDSDPTAFGEFLIAAVLTDKSFGADYKGLSAATKIHKAVEGAKAGEVVGLEDADWEMLKAAAQKPTGGYDPLRGMQLLPFIEAVLEAGTKPVQAVGDGRKAKK